MACELNLEFCTRSGGCSNCIHNTDRGPTYISPEQEERNKEYAQKIRAGRALRHKRFVEKFLPKVVVPLLGNTDGNGFFIKGYFVTAAHCLDNGPISFIYKGEKYTFDKRDAVVFETIDTSSEDIQTGDIAIFPFDKADSYLTIGQDLSILDSIKPGPILAHYKHTSEARTTNSIFSPSEEKYELCIDKFSSFANSILHKCNDHSNTYISYFFESETQASISEGSSGAPLLNDNHKVIGMLIGCRRPDTHPNLILFQHLQRFEYQLGLFGIDSIDDIDDQDLPF